MNYITVNKSTHNYIYISFIINATMTQFVIIINAIPCEHIQTGESIHVQNKIIYTRV